MKIKLKEKPKIVLKKIEKPRQEQILKGTRIPLEDGGEIILRGALMAYPPKQCPHRMNIDGIPSVDVVLCAFSCGIGCDMGLDLLSALKKRNHFEHFDKREKS